MEAEGPRGTCGNLRQQAGMHAAFANFTRHLRQGTMNSRGACGECGKGHNTHTHLCIFPRNG
eukprot:9339498-Prorocentrum_lima.AAC.1